jgi:hypothetical protein
MTSDTANLFHELYYELVRQLEQPEGTSRFSKKSSFGILDSGRSVMVWVNYRPEFLEVRRSHAGNAVLVAEWAPVPGESLILSDSAGRHLTLFEAANHLQQLLRDPEAI